MKTLLCVLLLQIVFHLGSSKRTCGVDFVRECTASGPLCENCDHLVVCLQKGDGWEKTSSATCLEPQKCLNGQCTTSADPVCDGIACLPFKCNSTGVFPDPFFCQKYHICIVKDNKVTQEIIDCSPGFRYNAKTTYCDVPLVNNQCAAYPLPPCTKAGDTGPLPENPSIYYVCEQYDATQLAVYPFQYLCPNGEVFENFTCIGS